jgi:hypothetical protein
MRGNCPASFTVRLCIKQEVYYTTKFFIEHNHILVSRTGMGSGQFGIGPEPIPVPILYSVSGRFGIPIFHMTSRPVPKYFGSVPFGSNRSDFAGFCTFAGFSILVCSVRF